MPEPRWLSHTWARRPLHVRVCALGEEAVMGRWAEPDGPASRTVLGIHLSLPPPNSKFLEGEPMSHSSCIPYATSVELLP